MGSPMQMPCCSMAQLCNHQEAPAPTQELQPKMETMEALARHFSQAAGAEGSQTHAC